MWVAHHDQHAYYPVKFVGSRSKTQKPPLMYWAATSKKISLCDVADYFANNQLCFTLTLEAYNNWIRNNFETYITYLSLHSSLRSRNPGLQESSRTNSLSWFLTILTNQFSGLMLCFLLLRWDYFHSEKDYFWPWRRDLCHFWFRCQNFWSWDNMGTSRVFMIGSWKLIKFSSATNPSVARQLWVY